MARTVKYTFNPFELTGRRAPRGADRDRALDAIADFVKTETLEFVGDTNSPVSGRGAFKRLTKEYRIRKRAEGGTPIPNLELDGDLLNALQTTVSGNRITLITSGKQGDKADGHNNHSGQSDLPTRRYIPKAKDGETFKKEIISGIRRIIDSFDN